MRPRFSRYAALILTSMSLVNGLLVGMVHHHRGRSVPHCEAPGLIHQHAGGACRSHPVEQRSQPASDPGKESEDCQICHLLAQQPTAPEVFPEVQPLAAQDWTRGESSRRAHTARRAAYQGRAPPV